MTETLKRQTPGWRREDERNNCFETWIPLKLLRMMSDGGHFDD
jgi:hypothetical protein